jgi:formamidopyrimidine-DNA glycosylase
MIELPEARALAGQMNETLVGKTITNAVAAHSKHTFAWYCGDPALYTPLLSGKTITGAAAFGGRPELHVENVVLSFMDGVRFRCHAAGAKLPDKHQLLLTFADGTALTCSIQMYGGIMASTNGFEGDNYYHEAVDKPSPYDPAFDMDYFNSLVSSVKPNISVKAFLATQQRIPGFGNGVLHDTLFNARIHPKRKLETLSDAEFDALFRSIKSTLQAMLDGGGRDTERDLFGNAGGYRTILSSKTLAYQCLACGGGLKREAYLGGNIYYCPSCQPVVR